MKIRVMANDGTYEDFEISEEEKAVQSFDKGMAKVRTVKVVGDIRPSCNIHYCYHDENPPRPCEIIERFTK